MLRSRKHGTGIPPLLRLAQALRTPKHSAERGIVEKRSEVRVAPRSDAERRTPPSFENEGFLRRVQWKRLRPTFVDKATPPSSRRPSHY